MSYPELQALADILDSKADVSEAEAKALRLHGGLEREAKSHDNRVARARYYAGICREAFDEIEKLNDRVKTLENGKKNPRVPESEEAKMICRIARRQDSTAWTVPEITAFKKLNLGEKDHADLAALLRYYEAQRAEEKAGRKGYHRRNLITFLNNYYGERDKALEWERTRPAKAIDPQGWSKWLESINKAYVPYAKALDYMKTEFKRSNAELNSRKETTDAD